MTGRLIEADKLRSWFESHSVWDEFPVGYIMGLIDEQPTVDAIPIEWLKQFRNGLDNLSECKLMEAIDTIIDAHKAERKEE